MIVGIEIGAGVLRAVKHRRSRPGRAPDETFEAAFTSADGLPPAEMVAALVRRLNARGARFAVAIPTADCRFRAAAFPYRAAARVGPTLPYALEGRVAGNVEEYVIEPLGALRPAGAKGSRLLAAACPRERLQALLARLQEAGVDPCLVQPAVVSAAEAVAPAAEKEDVLLARVDRAVEAAVVRRGEIVAALAVPLHGLNAADAGYAAAVAARLRWALRAYDFSDGDAAVARAILLCEPASRAALAAALGRELGAPVEPVREAPWAPQFAAAAGAAVQARRGAAGVNLRRGPFAHRGQQARAARRAAAALVLAAALAGLLGVLTLRQIRDVRAQLDGVRAEKTALMAKAGLPRSAPTLLVLKSALAQATHEAASRKAPMASCIDRWWEVQRFAPRDVSLDSLDIRPSGVKVTARAADTAKAAEYQKNLGTSRVFRPNPAITLGKAQGHLTTFTMELKYR